MLRFVSIVFLCVAAAVAYGLVHDQITVRVSLEYFTVLHPQILPADTSPTVLALAWGVIATWWVGLILGLILAIASCCGSRPSLSARHLIRPVCWLLLVMAVGATSAGVMGYELGVHGLLQPAPFVQQRIAPDQFNRVYAAGATHLASYGLGFVGGLVLSALAWRKRGKLLNHTYSK